MSSQVVTLYEDEAKTNALYPRTKISAISDDDGKALSETIGELNNKLENHVSITIDTLYYTDGISTIFNNSYKLDGLKIAFIYAQLEHNDSYPSTNVWGRIDCPPKSLIQIPAFIKLENDQWIPFYVVINANGEIRQECTSSAKAIHICGSYTYN